MCGLKSGISEDGRKRCMEYSEKRQRKNCIVDAVVFAVLLTVVSAVTLQLFYRQATGEIASDMEAYILEMQGLDSGYNFPYPVFFRLAAFFHFFCSPEWAVSLATMLLNGAAMTVTKLAFNHMAFSDLEAGSDSIFWRVVLSLSSVSLFFISMLYAPRGIYLPGIRFRYLGVFTANPFHNATYMAARPFAILAFLWYIRLIPVYEKENGIKGRKGDYVLFSLFLFLATITKPSFTLVMVSTCGLFMLYRLFAARFRNLVPTVWLGLCFIPTFLALLYQYSGVFIPDSGEEGGLGFCFGEIWAYYCDSIPLAVCLAIGFPLLVLVCNLRESRKHTLFRFSWMIYAVSFAEAFFLYEKGFRKPDFNFSWGYMYGIFFCHLGALLLLLKVTRREMRNGLEKKGKLLLTIQWMACLCHVVCGIFYFRDYYAGISYY